jgi:hypothetical protein
MDDNPGGRWDLGMACASELDMDVRPLWPHAFVLWGEHEPVVDKDIQEQIRAALKRLQIS